MGKKREEITEKIAEEITEKTKGNIPFLVADGEGKERALTRAPDGRWLPGIAYNPAGRGPRIRQDVQQAIMDSIRSPQEFWERIDEYCRQSEHASWANPLWARYRFSEPPKVTEVTGDVGVYRVDEVRAARAAVLAAERLALGEAGGAEGIEADSSDVPGQAEAVRIVH